MPELTAREALLLLAADLETIADHSLDSGSYGHAAAMARGRASALAETAREPVPVQPGTREEGRHTGALRAAVDAALSALLGRWPCMDPALAAEDATIAIGAAEPLIRADEQARIAAIVQPARLRTLADWFDMDDEFKAATFPGTWPAGSRADEVQQDLRAWADLLEQP